MVTDCAREKTLTTTVLPSPGTSSSDLAGKLKMIILKAVTIITVKRTLWMQNSKGNSCHLLQRNEKNQSLLSTSERVRLLPCVFFSAITYGKQLPHSLFIPPVCQTSPGLRRMNQKATANFHFPSIVAEFIMLLNASPLRALC